MDHLKMVSSAGVDLAFLPNISMKLPVFIQKSEAWRNVFKAIRDNVMPVFIKHRLISLDLLPVVEEPIAGPSSFPPPSPFHSMQSQPFFPLPPRPSSSSVHPSLQVKRELLNKPSLASHSTTNSSDNFWEQPTLYKDGFELEEIFPDPPPALPSAITFDVQSLPVQLPGLTPSPSLSTRPLFPDAGLQQMFPVSSVPSTPPRAINPRLLGSDNNQDQTPMDVGENPGTTLQKKKRVYISLPKRKGVVSMEANKTAHQSTHSGGKKIRKAQKNSKGKKKATAASDDDMVTDEPESEDRMDLGRGIAFTAPTDDDMDIDNIPGPVASAPNPLVAAMESSFAAANLDALRNEALILIAPNQVTDSGVTSAGASQLLSAFLLLSESDRASLLALSQEGLASGLQSLVNPKRKDAEDIESPEHKCCHCRSRSPSSSSSGPTS